MRTRRNLWITEKEPIHTTHTRRRILLNLQKFTTNNDIRLMLLFLCLFCFFPKSADCGRLTDLWQKRSFGPYIYGTYIFAYCTCLIKFNLIQRKNGIFFDGFGGLWGHKRSLINYYPRNVHTWKVKTENWIQLKFKTRIKIKNKQDAIIWDWDFMITRYCEIVSSQDWRSWWKTGAVLYDFKLKYTFKTLSICIVWRLSQI